MIRDQYVKELSVISDPNMKISYIVGEAQQFDHIHLPLQCLGQFFLICCWLWPQTLEA